MKKRSLRLFLECYYGLKFYKKPISNTGGFQLISKAFAIFTNNRKRQFSNILIKIVFKLDGHVYHNLLCRLEIIQFDNTV